jgi:hypothetical protein
MNELIKELVKKAGGRLSTHTLTSYPAQRRESIELWDKNIEKFAELIVKECMSMCDELKVEYFNHRKNTMDFDEKHIYAEGESACFNLRFKMKKHFGVEE